LGAADPEHAEIMMQSALARIERGAALLAAMLTVALVATFAAAALWQQWRSIEIEAAERARVQSAWVLIGALDWSRLILREDARAGGATAGADHLAEPWAVPLAEAKLTSFLAADKNISSDALAGLPEAFLSGRIVDAQSKLNVMNLIQNGQPDQAERASFSKLFEMLGLPAGELALLTRNLQQASVGINLAATGAAGAASAAASAPVRAATVDPSRDTGGGDAPLLPQQTSQLVWLGLSPATAAALEPYVTVLPRRTPLNINTASAEALYASVPSLDLANAKRVVAARTRTHFKGVQDANALLPGTSSGTGTGTGTVRFDENRHSVASSYFDVRGRLRLENTWVEEHSLLQRGQNADVTTVWRERGAGTTTEPLKP
jgi:general secretion pathway protein K